MYNFDHEPAAEAFLCVDPEVGGAALHGYLAETLSDEARQAFEDHLCFCLKCQEDLEQWRDLVESCKDAPPAVLRETLRDLTRQGMLEPEEAEFFFHESDAPESAVAPSQSLDFADVPLSVTALEDGAHTDLLPEFQSLPLVQRLAASSRAEGEPTFPLTLGYGAGEILAQFRRRAGQLFFRLQSARREGERVTCLLRYPSPDDVENVVSVLVHEGEEKRLGTFRAFAPANTMQELLTALRRFELRVSEE